MCTHVKKGETHSLLFIKMLYSEPQPSETKCQQKKLKSNKISSVSSKLSAGLYTEENVCSSKTSPTINMMIIR